jgi:hypothetical protein
VTLVLGLALASPAGLSGFASGIGFAGERSSRLAGKAPRKARRLAFRALSRRNGKPGRLAGPSRTPGALAPAAARHRRPAQCLHADAVCREL